MIREHIESKIKEWKALPQTPEIQALIRTYTKLLNSNKKAPKSEKTRKTRTMIRNL